MKQITVKEKDGKFFAEFDFDWDTKDLVKKAGFRFDPKIKKWWTTEKTVADRVSTPEAVNAWISEEHQQVKASAATDAEVDIPAPEGLNYLPYQRAGIAYAMDKDNVIIADEMGLGKTIQAIGIVNNDPSAFRVLIICPASLKLNWQREWKKWDTKNLGVKVVTSDEDFYLSQVVIVNYEMVHKYKDAIAAINWSVAICDEAHYLKNGQAKRTKAVLGYWDKKAKKKVPGCINAKRRVFLSGTPSLNRPIELWNLINAVDPGDLGRSVIYFGKRYCNGFQNAYGWDFSGASNPDELHDRMRRKFMVRRLKSDVLKDLPPKRRSIIAITPNKEQKKAMKKELEDLGINEKSYEKSVEALLDSGGVAFEDNARIRREVALLKVGNVIEHAEALLEETDKLVIMAHHHEVIDRITEAFGDRAVKLDGRMNQDQKQESVDRFQNDPSVKVFVGSIKAAGVGITLTASSTVLFAELDWTPGSMSQAEDRCHRIGQRDMVNVYHVVLDNSIDAHMAKVLVEKQKILDKTLDNEISDAPEVVEFTPSKGDGKKASVKGTHKATQAKTDKPVADITDSQIAAVHTALRRLASACDYAFQKDGTGFNGFDATFGHDLANRETLTPRQALTARKMLRKYRRQLGQEMIDAMFSKEEKAGS